MNRYIVMPEKEDTGKRIDIFLSDYFSDISRNLVQRSIEGGYVSVNGKSVKSNYKLKNNDVLSVEISVAENIEIIPEDIPIDILYEDDEIIVANKPQGMVVHPAPGHYTGTFVNALMYHCKENLSSIGGSLRPGIVHRIDKDTSGVIMAAKTDKSHISLAKQLSEHSITRKYIAVVYNKVKEDDGIIEAPIGRNPKDRKKMAITNNSSKHAITHYKVIERLGKFTYIEATLDTGRTHQIRVHMASMGHPLLGDEVYGKRKHPFNLKGQVLHAKILGINHPLTGEYMEFEAKAPAYFEKLINSLRIRI